MNPRYSTIPLSFNRKMVRASAGITGRKNAIHSITEVDISKPRKMLKEHAEITGEKLSFTGYVVACFVQAVKQNPKFNSFLKRNKLVLLKDVNVSVLVEREFEGEAVPEPMVIRAAQEKTYRQIHEEIRAAKKEEYKRMGESSGIGWIRFIPGFLLKAFVGLADKNIRMAEKYGKVAVTAVGMFSREPVWFVPHGTATVLVTVGSIVNQVVEVDGKYESREHLCLTVSFDHNVIDGAPAARFMNRFVETLKSGVLLENSL